MVNKLLFLLGFLLLSIAPSASAVHILGGDITYRCLGNGVYEFTVILLRDCVGTPVNSTSINLQGPVSASLPRIEVVDITPRCATATTYICSPSGTNQSPQGVVSRYTFRGNVNLSALPAAPATGYIWFVGANSLPCCRPTNNNSLSSFGTTALQVKMFPFTSPVTGAVLTPAQICDNSPVFQADPTSLAILNPNDTIFSQNFARDPDNRDSIVFGIDLPLSDNLIPYPYTQGYSLANPLPGLVGAPLVAPNNSPVNPISGEMVFRPIASGDFVYVIRVTTYRCGQKISEIFRDTNLKVVPNPTGSLPPYDPNPLSSTSLFSQRAPKIQPPILNAAGVGIYELTYYVNDTVDIPISVNDYFPTLTGNPSLPATWVPATNEFSTAFTGSIISTSNQSTTGCSSPPCVTLRGITDPSFPAPVVTVPQLITAGNGNPIGLGFNAISEGGGKISWTPACSNLPTNAIISCIRSSTRYQVSVIATDKHCPIEGRETRVYTFTIQNLPKFDAPEVLAITPNGNTSLTVHFRLNIDTLSIDPVDSTNFLTQSQAFKLNKSVTRRKSSFLRYRIYRATNPMGPFTLIDSTDALYTYERTYTGLDLVNNDYFFYITTVSGCRGEESAPSDTIRTCERQPIAINSPGGSFYCPTTGTVINAQTNATGVQQWFKDGVAIPGANSASYLVMSPGNYTFVVTASTGCEYVSPVQPMMPSNLPYEGEVICAVTVDVTTGLNQVLWDKTEDKGTVSYAVLREENATGIYNQIAVVPFGLAGLFVDTSARSALAAYRYKIQVQDVCSRSASASPAHRTMRLQATVAANNAVSLNWNAYEGIGTSSYEILRSTGGTFNVIGQTSGFSFTDQMAPIGPKVYVVSTDSSAACHVGSGLTPIYSNAISLGSGVSTQEFEPTSINIYPNPSTGDVRIQSLQRMDQLIIRDMRGRLILRSEPLATVYDLNLATLEKGVYLVEVKQRNGLFFQRLILQ